MEDGTFVGTTRPNYQISSLAMKAIGADIVARILFLIPSQETNAATPLWVHEGTILNWSEAAIKISTPISRSTASRNH